MQVKRRKITKILLFSFPRFFSRKKSQKSIISIKFNDRNSILLCLKLCCCTPRKTKILSFEIPYSTIFSSFFMKFFRKRRKKSQKFDFLIIFYDRNSILPHLKQYSCTSKTTKILSFQIPYSMIF